MDLTTRYLGLGLRNPLIASASPLSGDIGSLRRLEDAGIAAVVLPSLFEEQIRHDDAAIEAMFSASADSSPEASGYFVAALDYNGGPTGYLDLVRRAVTALDIPVIASLNGTTATNWIDHAILIEQAGAAALELNIYRIADQLTTTGAAVEAEYVALVRAVRARVRIPLAVKLHPHVSAFGDLAHRLDAAGADGLVLFNRLYLPDIDLARLRWHTPIGLSRPEEMRLGLHWLSVLAGRLPHTSLAAGTGVETGEDIVKYLLAGADAVMTASSLLRNGASHARTLIDGLHAWLERRHFRSVAAITGLMRAHGSADRIAAEQRGTYIHALLNFPTP
ncbi:dihydroorotate dehydrogenase-like protein [Acidiphilium sp.]|uniref:dihydroorotate dehydrogenase-like protein n=1 Tax=Acidiphilium sp. TaxID=527 RepID=UPI003D012352